MSCVCYSYNANVGVFPSSKGWRGDNTLNSLFLQINSQWPSSGKIYIFPLPLFPLCFLHLSILHNNTSFQCLPSYCRIYYGILLLVTPHLFTLLAGHRANSIRYSFTDLSPPPSNCGHRTSSHQWDVSTSVMCHLSTT